MRVTVVGGGLAGLAAALDLVDSGWDVTVLEARPTLGGAVQTLPEREGTPLWLCRGVVRSFGGELAVSQGLLGGRRVVLRLRTDRL